MSLGDEEIEKPIETAVSIVIARKRQLARFVNLLQLLSNFVKLATYIQLQVA